VFYGVRIEMDHKMERERCFDVLVLVPCHGMDASRIEQTKEPIGVLLEFSHGAL
jgi:hypothetical protein